MKWFIIAFFFSSPLFAQVTQEHVDDMINQMVQKQIITEAQAKEAKAKLQNINQEQWKQINASTKTLSKRLPASKQADSLNRVEEVQEMDLNGEEFKKVQAEIEKIMKK